MNEGSQALGTVDDALRRLREMPMKPLELFLPGIDGEDAFLDVIRSYLQGSEPPAFSTPKKHGASWDFERAVSYADNLVWRLWHLKMRLEDQANGRGGAEWDQECARKQATWRERQSHLANLLREAADLFDSGQCDVGPSPTVEKYHSEELPQFRGVDDVHWCGSDNLRRWAETVELSPVETVFPVATPAPEGRLFRPEDVKFHGGAVNSSGALRAMIVRGVFPYIPNAMLSDGGYSVVARLLCFIGLDVNRQHVRALYSKDLPKDHAGSEIELVDQYLRAQPPRVKR